MDPDKLAAEHLKVAQDLSNKTTQIALVLFAALVVAWFANFAPKLPAFKAAIVYKNRYLRADQYLKSTRRNTERRAPGGEQEPQAAKKRVQRAIRSRDEQYELFKRKQILVEAVTFELFGLKVGVVGYWAPMFWIFLYAIGLTYVALSRCVVVDRYTRALDLLNGVGDLDVGARLGLLAIWVLPLRRKSRLYKSIAWGNSIEWASVLSVSLIGICSVIAIFAFSLTASFPSVVAPSSRIGVYLYRPIAIFLLLLSAVAFSSWIFPLPRQSIPTRSAMLTMRRKLLQSGSALVGAYTTFLILPLITRAILLNPRFRRPVRLAKFQGNPRWKRRPRGLQVRRPTGFYYELKRSAIHYVGPSGHARSLWKVPESDTVWLAQAEYQAHEKDNVAFGHRTAWVRALTKLKIEQGRLDAAHEIISRSAAEVSRSLAGIGSGRRHVDLQVLDLLARLAVFTKNESYLDEAKHFAQKLSQSLKQSFPSKIPRVARLQAGLDGRLQLWGQTKWFEGHRKFVVRNRRAIRAVPNPRVGWIRELVRLVF
jgi:hypothetical protein